VEEAEARTRLDVSRETLERLDHYVALLASENGRQNLVSRSSLEHVWSRHILDSAQLIRFAPETDVDWIDLGSGAGLPGMVVAMLHRRMMTLVENRPARARFLVETVRALGLESQVTVLACAAKTVPSRAFDVITARAFAPLGQLLAEGLRFAGPDTVWILPKGRSAKSELEAVRASWQGDFALEPSVTDTDAFIVVASNVRRARPARPGAADMRAGIRT